MDMLPRERSRNIKAIFSCIRNPNKVTKSKVKWRQLWQVLQQRMVMVAPDEQRRGKTHKQPQNHYVCCWPH
ncbi:hypothetical protein AMECASPLE_008124 [Ameca splendens]|uniref:Uncharacterized protein n=1 Tax=Ameca splendens TaxID=208324 RepID=A0ABV0Z9M1_9TELE